MDRLNHINGILPYLAFVVIPGLAYAARVAIQKTRRPR